MRKNNSNFPNYISKYFWGDNLADLSWNKHHDYIIKTILEEGDKEAVKWLLKRVSKKELKNTLSTLRLTPKSSNFWWLYLS